MNEQLENKLSDFLDYLGTMTKAGVDVTKSQYPELIKELIRYKLVINYMYSIVTFMIIVGSIFLIFYGYNLPEEQTQYELTRMTASATFSVIIGIICLVISFFSFISMIQEIIQIKLAPKVYILEYISDILVKKKQND